jgi:arylformamidase
VRDLAYGPGPRERLDLYLPQNAANCPVHVFIHGGYWRAGSKELYVFVADSVCAAGGIAVMVEYGLMPAVRMATIVEQVRRALVWVERNARTYGGDPAALSISGHSAGAHLASFALARAHHDADAAIPAVREALLVSGIYDLAPIAQSFLQPEISLTQEEIGRWSPLRADWIGRAAVSIVVGEKETTPFHDQAAAFAAKLKLARAGVEQRVAPAEDHMTVVRALGRRGTMMADMLTACIERSRTVR